MHHSLCYVIGHLYGLMVGTYKGSNRQSLFSFGVFACEHYNTVTLYYKAAINYKSVICTSYNMLVALLTPPFPPRRLTALVLKKKKKGVGVGDWHTIDTHSNSVNRLTPE